MNMLIKFSLRYESQVAKPPAEMISKAKVDEVLTSFVNKAVDLFFFIFFIFCTSTTTSIPIKYYYKYTKYTSYYT